MKLDIPYGPNNARIMGYEFGQLDNEKQTPYIEIKFNFPDYGDGWQKFFLSEKAAPYTLKKLKKLGCEALDKEPTRDGDVLNMEGFALYDVCGGEVEVEVRSNKQNPEYKDIDILTGGGGTPMDDKKSSKLGAQLRAIYKAKNGESEKDPWDK